MGGFVFKIAKPDHEQKKLEHAALGFARLHNFAVKTVEPDITLIPSPMKNDPNRGAWHTRFWNVSQNLGAELHKRGAWHRNCWAQLSTRGTQPILVWWTVGAGPRKCEAWHNYKGHAALGFARLHSFGVIYRACMHISGEKHSKPWSLTQLHNA